MQTLATIATAITLAVAGSVAVAADKPAVNDAQIAQIVVTANSIDIENGKIALQNSKTSGVDEFAHLMVKDHTAVNDNATALVKKLGVTPEASDTSKSLQSSADTEQAKLRGMKGHDFDREYLQNEVNYHKQVIDALDKTLIPNARNAELKKMLVDVRPAFQAHLEHAEKTLAALDTH